MASGLKPKGCRFCQSITAKGPMSKALSPQLLPRLLTWLPRFACSCISPLNVNAVTLLMGEELFFLILQDAALRQGCFIQFTGIVDQCCVHTLCEVLWYVPPECHWGRPKAKTINRQWNKQTVAPHLRVKAFVRSRSQSFILLQQRSNALLWGVELCTEWYFNTEMKVSFLGHCFPQWPSRLGKRRWRMQHNPPAAQLRKTREIAATALNPGSDEGKVPTVHKRGGVGNPITSVSSFTGQRDQSYEQVMK